VILIFFCTLWYLSSTYFGTQRFYRDISTYFYIWISSLYIWMLSVCSVAKICLKIWVSKTSSKSIELKYYYSYRIYFIYLNDWICSFRLGSKTYLWACWTLSIYAIFEWLYCDDSGISRTDWWMIYSNRLNFWRVDYIRWLFHVFWYIWPTQGSWSNISKMSIGSYSQFYIYYRSLKRLWRVSVWYYEHSLWLLWLIPFSPLYD